MSAIRDSLFAKCVHGATANWDILRSLVANQSGGEDSVEKAQWVPTVLVDLFISEGDEVDLGRLTDYLDDILINEFEAEVDTSILSMFSKGVMKLWRAFRRAEMQVLEEFLQTQPPPSAAPAVMDATDEVDDSEAEDELKEDEGEEGEGEWEDEEEEEPSEDEDGWRTVKPKSKPGRN